MAAKEGQKKKDSSNESRIGSIMKAAMRLLIKVKNFYFDAIVGCSGQLDYGVALSCPGGQVPATLPHSWSVNSAKSSSRRVYYSGVPGAGANRRPMVRKSAMEVVPRSQSVGIGKIDEENECEFGEDGVVGARAYPRSRSYAF